MKNTDNKTDTCPFEHFGSLNLRECFADIFSTNGLPPDEHAFALLYEFAMQGYVVYPRSDGGFLVGMNGTLTHFCDSIALEKNAVKLGFLI